MSERTRNIHSEEEECVMVNGRGADRLRRWSVREAARRSAGRLSQSLARDNDERYPGLKVKKNHCGAAAAVVIIIMISQKVGQSRRHGAPPRPGGGARQQAEQQKRQYSLTRG